MTHRSISNRLQNTIYRLYGEGLSITRIADDLRLDRSTVHKYLLQEGLIELDTEAVEEGKIRYSDDEIERMVQMYVDDVPLKDIQEAFDVSAPTIYRHVDNAGVKRKGLPKGDIDLAIQMYKEKRYSVNEILEISGVPRTSFYAEKKRREAEGIW